MVIVKAKVVPHQQTRTVSARLADTNKRGQSPLLPTIYRKDPFSRTKGCWSISSKLLDSASNLLKNGQRGGKKIGNWLTNNAPHLFFVS